VNVSGGQTRSGQSRKQMSSKRKESIRGKKMRKSKSELLPSSEDGFHMAKRAEIKASNWRKRNQEGSTASLLAY